MSSNRNSDKTGGKRVLTKTRTKTAQAGKTTKTKEGQAGKAKVPGKALDETLHLLRLVPRGAVLPNRPFTDERGVLLTEFSEIDHAMQQLPPKLAAYLKQVISADYEPLRGLLKALYVYERIASEREIFEKIIHLIHRGDTQRLRECKICRGIFFAEQPNQQLCLEKDCLVEAKKRRQENWQKNYKKTHGYAYRQVREPRRRARVRKQLERWEAEKGPFEPTNGNMKDLAAYSDITLKQCQVEYEKILNEKSGPRRARKARKGPNH